MTKCEVLCWSGEIPEEAGAGITRAGKDINRTWEPVFLMYGIPVGTDNYVESMLDTKIDEIESIAIKACEVLAGEVQTLWTLFRLSTIQQFDY